jgi:tetratricopeptide (TPR) repeat protein
LIINLSLSFYLYQKTIIVKKAVGLAILLMMISALCFSQDTTKKAAGQVDVQVDPGAISHQLDSLTLRIQINPNNDTAYLTRAYIRYGLMKDFHGAIIDCTQAIRCKHFLPDAYGMRASVKDSLLDYKGAIADLDSAILFLPPNAPALPVEQLYAARAFAKDCLGDFAGAVADCNKQIQMNPNLSMSYCQRAYAKIGLEDYKGAIADNDRAIALDSTNVAAFNNRAFEKNKLKEYASAIADCNIALKRDTGTAITAYAYANRGHARHGLKDYQNAAADFDKSIQLAPRNAVAYYYRGLQEYDLKDIKAALADFDKAIELEPDTRPFYTARADAKDAAGDHAGAKSDKAKAATITTKSQKI